MLYPNDDLVLPSLWEALTGRQDVDWAERENGGRFVDFTPDFAQVWRWKDELPEQRLVCAGKHLGGKASLVSLRLLPSLYALTGRAGRADDFRDEECVTPETPEARVREFSEGVDERVIVTAHVHIQFDREVAGIRSVNAGSVGLPYEGKRGAYWALLGPDVELRRTEYDLDQTIALYRATDQPGIEQIVEMMVEPPEPREVIDHAEKVVFAG